MENTNNSKVTEEISPLDNAETASTSPTIVISERGGVAPNASAAAQRLIQSSETNDVLVFKSYCEAVDAYERITESHPELASLAFEKIDKAQERVCTLAKFKSVVKGFAMLGFAGFGAYCAHTYNNNRVQYIDLSDEEESCDEDEAITS